MACGVLLVVMLWCRVEWGRGRSGSGGGDALYYNQAWYNIYQARYEYVYVYVSYQIVEVYVRKQQEAARV